MTAARGKAAAGCLMLLMGPAMVLAQTGPGAAVAKSAGKGDKELGEYLSSQCTACHQISGKAVGGIPPIVGWPEDQFIAVFQSYRNGTRENQTMRAISHRFSDAEVEALAAYFGALTPAR